MLSSRGERALVRPPLIKCALFENQFSYEKIDGLVNLGVAENSLLTEYLMSYYQTHFKLDQSDFTYGTALGGSIRLFEAIRNLSEKYFHAIRSVERDHIIAGSGCGSVIDLLVSTLCDEGDGILVGKPYYNGFAASFECRSGVVPVGVTLPTGLEAEESCIEYFEEALKESELKGIKIRAVMLCNPHNPLGFCYSKETIKCYMRFAEQYQIHFISDEIYALSTYESANTMGAQNFVSALSIDPLLEAGCSLSRVHVIYGASKDWGANGFRIGYLISQGNAQLHTAMESSCLLMKISSPADALWSGLLCDSVNLPIYLQLNKANMESSYNLALDFLASHSINYRHANAGHFIWIDLRSHLPTHDDKGVLIESEWAREDALALKFIHNGVNVARGGAYSHTEAGFFRLTFTVRRDYFETGLLRIEKALGFTSTKDLSEKLPLSVLELEKALLDSSVVDVVL